jgi:hypothetical protein
VTAGEQAGEDAAQHLVLADDHLLDLADEDVEVVLDRFELGLRLGDRHVEGQGDSIHADHCPTGGDRRPFSGAPGICRCDEVGVAWARFRLA